MRILLLLSFLFIGGSSYAQIYRASLPHKRDPNLNKTVSPDANEKINPLKNIRINPKYNHALNPYSNPALNPVTNALVNPKHNTSLNPDYNEFINPLKTRALNPDMGANWVGYYYFNKDGQLQGYFVLASQKVLVCLDLEGGWKGNLVETEPGVFNWFNLDNEWTGIFAVSDEDSGLNLFGKDGDWTGEFAK